MKSILIIISCLTFITVFLTGMLIGQHIIKCSDPEWVQERYNEHNNITPMPR